MTIDKLFDFRGLAHNATSIIAAVDGLAGVRIKSCLNFRIRFVLRDFAGPELRIAALAKSDGREGWFHDPEFALLHTIRIRRTFLFQLPMVVAL